METRAILEKDFFLRVERSRILRFQCTYISTDTRMWYHFSGQCVACQRACKLVETTWRSSVEVKWRFEIDRRKLAYDVATWAKVALRGTVKKVSQIATHLRGGMVRKREGEDARGRESRCERGTFGFQPARIPFARIHQHIYAFSAFPRVCINHVDHHHHHHRHRHA